MTGKESSLDLLCSSKGDSSFQAKTSKARTSEKAPQQTHLGAPTIPRLFFRAPLGGVPPSSLQVGAQQTHSLHLLAADHPHTDIHLKTHLCTSMSIAPLGFLWM